MIHKGKSFGPYEVVEKIGQGGMGVVYRARELRLKRDVALKILPDRLATNPAFTKRFLREAQAAARIEHPGIVSIYGVGEESGSYWIAMQLISGKPLTESMTSGPMEVAAVLAIAREAAEALDYAHKQGVIHRDVKPDNIMLDENGRLKIMDFGLAKAPAFDAKITESGVYLGTPEYSSPEQCESQDVDGRSDLYSLGVVLYEALTGQVPHSAETPYSLFKKIVDDPPVPIRKINPEVPPSVEAVVEKLMQKDRDKRYASARDLIHDLDKISRSPSTSDVGGSDTSLLGTRVEEREKAGLPLFGIIGAAAVGLASIVVVLALSLGKGPAENPLPPQPGDSGYAPAVQPAPPAEADELPVVAMILDFQNPTNSDELAWMRVGVPDMLISDLAQLPWLKVHSQERVMAEMERLGADSMNDAETLRRLGETLEADILIKGTFVEVGGKVKITIRVLTHPLDDLILSHNITGTLDELLTMVDNLTGMIREGLRARFQPEEKDDLKAPEETVSLRTQTAEVSLVVQDSLDKAKPPARALDEERDLLRKLASRIQEHLNKDAEGEFDLLQALREEQKVLKGGISGGRKAPAAPGAPADPLAEADEKRGFAPRKRLEEPEKAEAEDSADDEEAEADERGPAPRPSGSPAPAPKKGLRDDKPSEADRGDRIAGKPVETEGKKRRAGERERQHGEPASPAEAMAPASKAKKAEAMRRMKKSKDGALAFGAIQFRITLPTNKKARARVLAYKARNIRDLASDDPKSLLASYSMLNEALKLDPRFKFAQNELQKLLAILKALD